MDFPGILKIWYRQHHRDLPWRHTRDPYKIWLSEVILQQTRVDQGMNYYHAFTETYPKVGDLAAASEESVLKLWQGLGYYSRARNLHATAIHIVKELNGVFPPDYDGLLRLKGVGEYTAAAIASICYKEPKPVIDGNVYRVLSRVFGIKTAIDSTAGKKEFRELAERLMDHTEPDIYNQAVMEFGARQCVPRNPDCSVCPLLGHCEAQRKKITDQLPVKSKKQQQRDRYFHYLVLRHGNNVYIRRREDNDIWKGLFDFPLVETEAPAEPATLAKAKAWTTITGGVQHTIESISDLYRHVLSHQKLHVRFYEIDLRKALPAAAAKGLLKIDQQQLNEFAVPILIHRYLGERQLSLF